MNIFTGRLDKLGALQQERKQLGDLYREQQFGTRADREAAKQTLNRIKVLDSQSTMKLGYANTRKAVSDHCR